MPQPSITIRPALLAEAGQLATLGRRVFAATYGAAIPPATLEAYLAEQFAPAAFEVRIRAPLPPLVALCDGAPAGYARLERSQPPECVTSMRAVELAQLYVDEAYQGRGVGAALLAASATLASEGLWLCAWEHNLRALRFYRRHGFAVVGRATVEVREIVFEDYVLARAGAEPGGAGR
jgi:diamine N-acetyltransferase